MINLCYIRFQEVIERLDIRPLLSKKIIQLSNGEMRKIQIARALLRNPRLLILDNPLTGLDHCFRDKMGEILKQLMSTDMRIMVVATIKGDIPSGTTHVLLVQRNRVFAQGPAKEILEGNAARAIWEIRHEESYKPDNFKGATGSETGEDKFPVLVEMHNVHIRYGDQEILKSIDWTIKNGEN